MTITIGKTVRACGMSCRHNVRPNPDVLWLNSFLNVSVKPSVHLKHEFPDLFKWGGKSRLPPRFEESTHLGCFSSKNNKKHSFCVEFAEVFRFMIGKKIWSGKCSKKWFEELSLQGFFNLPIKKERKIQNLTKKISKKSKKHFFWFFLLWWKYLSKKNTSHLELSEQPYSQKLLFWNLVLTLYTDLGTRTLRISRSTSEFHDWSLSEQPFGPTKINNFIFLIHKRDREPTRILSVPGKVKTRCLGPQTRPDLTRDAQTQSVILKRTATLLSTDVRQVVVGS